MRKGMKLIREHDNGYSGLLRLSHPEAPDELDVFIKERKGWHSPSSASVCSSGCL